MVVAWSCGVCPPKPENEGEKVVAGTAQPVQKKNRTTRFGKCLGMSIPRHAFESRSIRVPSNERLATFLNLQAREKKKRGRFLENKSVPYFPPLAATLAENFSKLIA